MAEKRALIGQPGILCSLDAQGIVCSLLFWFFKLIHVVSHDQVYYYQDVRWRDEMYDKDILMLQVGGSKTQMCIFNVLMYDAHHKLLTDRCFHNGTQPIPHVNLVEI